MIRYIYITPYKYISSYYLNQARGHQEETHYPSHRFRCLFPDLCLIYMALASIFLCFVEARRILIVCAYVCLYIYTYTYTYIQIQKFISAYRYILHEFPRHCSWIVSWYTYKHGQTSKTDPKTLFEIYVYECVCVCATIKAQNDCFLKIAHPFVRLEPTTSLLHAEYT